MAQLSSEDYLQMKQNALDMSKRLNEGYYIKQGLAAANDYLNQHV
jgi:hypothetical protein